MASDLALDGNRESGHSYKVRLALVLVLGQIAHSYEPIDIFVPHVSAWLERIRNLPHWKAPYALLA